MNKAFEDFTSDPVSDEEIEKSIGPETVERLRESRRYTWKDFLAYLAKDRISYIFIPTGADELWGAGSVNLVCQGPPMIDPLLKEEYGDHETAKSIGGLEHGIFLTKDGEVCYVPAAEAVAFDPKQRVACMTWWPGKPPVIYNTLVREGGRIPMQGMNAFNRYRRPHLMLAGKFTEPTMWLDHLKLLYPDDWQHILYWLAWRVQHPEVKIHHALVLGGPTRIGKDTILKPVTYAIGPWNFKSTNAQTVMDEPKYNGYLEAVICIIHEARDFGDRDRHGFYERTKPWIGGTATGVIMVADKYVRAHPVIDLVGFIITTNHKVRGLFLPDDDARHYVAWSNWTRQALGDHFGYQVDLTGKKKDELEEKYFDPLYDWYAKGGYECVAHYLMTLPLNDFSPTAPPPKTAAWHEIVKAYADPNKSVLTGIIESLGNPEAVTIAEITAADRNDTLEWALKKGRNVIPGDMEDAGYVTQHNPGAKSGDWLIRKKGKKSQVKLTIYVQAKLSPDERLRAARDLVDREQNRPEQAPKSAAEQEGDDFGEG